MEGSEAHELWEVSPELERKMQTAARELRKALTSSEKILWNAIRG
jgi:very-short-patch-repair endonuclease